MWYFGGSHVALSQRILSFLLNVLALLCLYHSFINVDDYPLKQGQF